MAFDSHGTLQAHLDGSILVVTAKGPWNLESLTESAATVGPLLEQLYDKPWAVLGVFRGEPLYVPEAAKRITDIVIEEKRRGRVASAVVVSGSSSPEMGKIHISDIYRNAGENFAFFDTLEQGKRWLFGQLQQGLTEQG